MFFQNSSPKGISGQNMSDPLKWSLTEDSRFLQAPMVPVRMEKWKNGSQNVLNSPSKPWAKCV